jgi:cell division protease FtsH
VSFGCVFRAPFQLIIIIIGVDFYNEKNSGGAGGGGQIFNIGKSKAKLLTKNRCKTKDVAGLEGAKKRYKKL